jgi:hypothetical protein
MQRDWWQSKKKRRRRRRRRRRGMARDGRIQEKGACELWSFVYVMMMMTMMMMVC